ncbi:MAG TPA: non-heme iron oxygenase ferredoxin subunit [Steroidobacteraceae bacterium]|nr:non-heme iron oxygenase ferredoxin subunit [Steroidobacteraceae bacterium]
MESGWVDIGPADSVTEDAGLSAEVDGYVVLVVRCGDALYAVEDRCTHDGEPLDGGEIAACEVVCPRHGARFDLRSGEALTPPAYEPLRTFPVRIDAGRVLIEKPA